MQPGAVDVLTGPIETCECNVQRALGPVVDEPPDHLAALSIRRERTVQLHTDCSAVKITSLSYAIIVELSKLFDLASHGRFLTKIANSVVDSRVVVWRREFLLGRTQRVRVGRQLSAEVRVTSGVSQGSVLGPLLFLAYVKDIWRYMESTIRLFADDCVIYRKIINNADVEKLQKTCTSWGIGRLKMQ